MENIPQIFDYDHAKIRVVVKQGEPWWVAKDVCDVLELGNSRQAVSRLDDDEKNTVTLNDGNRGNPNVTVVNEPGLYTLILASRRPEAKAFKRWITHEVIPAIRKHGLYATNDMAETMLDDPDFMIAALTKLKAERQKVAQLTAQVLDQDQKLQLFRNLQSLNEMLRASDIGQYYGISAKEFNKLMLDAGVIKRLDHNISGRNPYYVMTSKYSHTRYCQVITETLKSGNRIKTNVWLPQSLEFIDEIMNHNGYEFNV